MSENMIGYGLYISGCMTALGLTYLLDNQAIIVAYVLGMWTQRLFSYFESRFERKCK
jgi:hypothetical protein